jgi:hypothetical protein
MKFKKLFALGSLIGALYVGTVVLTPTLLTSCTTTQKTVAYNTLNAIATTVDASLKAYADLVVAGKVDQATQIKVADAKAKYEVAFAAAVAAARGNLQNPTPADVQALADSLTAIVKAITG